MKSNHYARRVSARCSRAGAVRAQSPNTASIVVIVDDASGGAVGGASVTVVNTATGATRELSSGDGWQRDRFAGAAAGRRLLGHGHARADSRPRTLAERSTLRAAETATLRVRLNVGATQSEVTVYGTTGGVRADPQLGMRLPAEQIDETPLLGRKVTYLPLLNSAFRQRQGHWRPVRQSVPTS